MNKTSSAMKPLGKHVLCMHSVEHSRFQGLPSKHATSKVADLDIRRVVMSCRSRPSHVTKQWLAVGAYAPEAG